MIRRDWSSKHDVTIRARVERLRIGAEDEVLSNTGISTYNRIAKPQLQAALAADTSF